jgi:hypothetical protein
MRLGLIGLIGAIALGGMAPTADVPFSAPARPPAFHGVVDSSRYVALKDGTRIAIDLILPQDLTPGARLPAVLKISRLGRAPPGGRIDPEDRFWAEHGYARILVDERGTGASFGTSRLGAATTSDLAEIVDWVVAQPWSNGRVGATGISVEGTAAELLAATGRPAVRAVAPLFSDYDYYADLVRPGGVYDSWLTRTFQGFTLQADRGGAAKPVDADVDGKLAAAAVAEHRDNLDIDAMTRTAGFADDAAPAAGGSLESLSASALRSRLARAGVPMLVYVSWLDAGTAQGALRRFHDLPNPQTVVIGAWSHAGGFDADPFAPRRPVVPSLLQRRFELLRFFDEHLATDAKGPPPSKRIWYYTLGEGRWRSTPRWPPQGLTRTSLHLVGETLQPGVARAGARQLRLKPADTGEANRWRTQMGGNAVDYARAMGAMQALPAFTSSPLDRPLEITGQAVLRLKLSLGRADDPAIFGYLVGVDPQGHAVYLTEGQLRLVDRKLAAGTASLHSYHRADALPVPASRPFAAVVTLLPTSVLVPKGWRVRLLLASGDRSTFETAGEVPATIFPASTLELPTARRQP